MDNFGTRMRAFRESKNMTITHLAELCNSSENVIRGYEKSRRLPNVEMMIRICNALEITPNFLLQDALTFEINKDRNHLYNIIDNLTPSQVSFVEDFLTTLHKQK